MGFTNTSSIGGLALMTAVAACGGAASDDDILPLPVQPCEARMPPATFVRRQGPLLLSDGQRFRAVGANLYYLQQLFSYAEQGDAASALVAQQALDQAACLGFSVVRAWAFNDSQDVSSIRRTANEFREAGLAGLDRAVAEAKARGLRLILTLVNNHADYGGLDQYAAWAGGTHDDFFTNEQRHTTWKAFVDVLAARTNTITGVAYKDEPAILAWELANEFRCPTCSDSTAFLRTVSVLAAYAKAAFPNHLIADGGEGFDDVPSLYKGLTNAYPVRGDEGVSYSKMLAIEALDMVSYHLYPRHWQLNVARDVQIWIDKHEAQARAAGKVAYLGEFGHKERDQPPTDPATRDNILAPLFNSWLQRLFDHNKGHMALMWQLVPWSRLSQTDDGFGIAYDNHVKTAQVLASWAARTSM